MARLTLHISSIDDNSLSFSGNFRIFSTIEPVNTILNITSIIEDVNINGNVGSNIKRYFRYSKDGDNWSMWYDYEPYSSPELGVIGSIEFNPDDFLYFSFKYLYDDGTHNELSDIITVNSIDLQFNTKSTKVPLRLNRINVNAKCSQESCPELLFNRDSKLNLYDIGNLSDVYLNMSRSINELAGLPVLYFQTIPNESGTDFIFREYSLYNVTSRKCIKVVVDKNEFPKSDFMYQGSDMNYQGPFEINIDKAYFESMFGRKKEPRKKDFLYFPLINRMYEIQDVTMFRGLMMMPVYWKASLVKFKPNLNLKMQDQDAQFLDNMILDSEEQFGKEANEQELNSLMTQQYTSVSTQNDEVREYLDPNIRINETEINYNYTRMINYYYNMSSVTNSSDLGVIYKDSAKISIDNDVTFMFNFNILSSATTGNLIFVTTDGVGGNILIDGDYSNSNQSLELRVTINGNVYILDLLDIQKGYWYSTIISISPTYKQVGMYVYSYEYDPIDNDNITGFNLINKSLISIMNISDITINDNNKFALLKGNILLSNFRIFNRTIEEEKHEFIISQLFIRDESMLRVIDNSRPKMGMPYLMKKY